MIKNVYFLVQLLNCWGHINPEAHKWNRKRRPFEG